MNATETRARLTDTDPHVRRQALDALLAACGDGQVRCQPSSDLLNLHCHTFFSYNGYGHSPTSLAWLAKESGWRALATVDFDVLDGVDETLQACERVGVRGAAGLETRTYAAAYSTREINSPGEPGVCYQIGVGFARSAVPAAAQGMLAELRRRAAERNRQMVARINAYLDPVRLDYDRDVLPLTPAGNATERHILVAYDTVARRHYPQREALVAFWARALGVDPARVGQELGAKPTPVEIMRSKLMKRGGVGYVEPGPDTFPPLAEVNRFIVACGAIPLVSWLDGASEGEQHIEELAQMLIAQGAGGLNIIPDRNWNIADAAVRAVKLKALYDVVDLARALDLPLIIGTEMNKAGQPLVDDFDAAPMRPLRADFVRGADFLYGHTLMQRALGMGYHSTWAHTHLPGRKERNAFYTTVGRQVAPGAGNLARVAQLDASATPDACLARLAP